MKRKFKKVINFFSHHNPIVVIRHMKEIPRAFHAFCIGAPKTGTKSIAHLFEANWRSIHEPYVGLLIRFLIKYDKKEIPANVVKAYLMYRDTYFYLHMESNHALILALPLLVDLYPNAKYIITIRDPKSWLRSRVNFTAQKSIMRDSDKGWGLLQKHIYGQFEKNITTTLEVGLDPSKHYQLASYLQGWAWHYERVLNFIDPNNLLLIPTQKISNSHRKIVEFLAIRSETLQQHSVHSNQTRLDTGIIESLPSRYIGALVEEHCQSIWNRLTTHPSYSVQ